MITMTEAVARRFAQDRPGLTLLHFEEVALPLFRVILDAIVQRRKPVPPIEEFVLRSVASGLDTVDEIEGILGLERPLVEAAIASQWHTDNIDYGASLGDPVQRVRLSFTGQRALDELEMMTPERMELVVDFDRLTWGIARLATPAPLRPRDVKELTLREIPPRQTRRPELEDLPIEGLDELMKQASVAKMSDVDLLGVRHVVRAERIYEAAVMLVYGSQSGTEPEVAFAIDGRLSRDHEHALAEVGGAGRLGFDVSAASVEEPALAKELQKRLVPSERVEELQRRAVHTEMRLEKLRAATATKEPQVEVIEADQSERELEKELEGIRNELESIAVRRVSVYEHPILLREALSATSRRLLIISPWITAAVANRSFLSDLEALCRKGVKIHIGYGINDEKAQYTRDRDAERRLQALAARHDNFVLKRLGYTHAKVLIWDDKWVTTSFNWLSFRGDPRRTFRQEEGILVGVKTEVDKTYEQYLAEIEAEEVS